MSLCKVANSKGPLYSQKESPYFGPSCTSISAVTVGPCSSIITFIFLTLINFDF